MPPSYYKCCSMDITSSKIRKAFNTLRPRQDGRHFPDDIFKWIFLNKIIWILIEISSLVLKFVLKGPINNIPALVQIMAWRRPGYKPLSEPMMISVPTHICITRPQWVNGEIDKWNSSNPHLRGVHYSCQYCFIPWPLSVEVQPVLTG